MAFNGELYEIFSCLPAKSIFRFAAAAKSCGEFSSEDFFIKKQSQRMAQKNDSAFFMQPDLNWRKGGQPEFHALPGEKNSIGVPNSSLDFLNKFGHLVGSSNGLVCCKSAKHIDNELFICNPTTQSWLPIPHPWRFQHTHWEFDVVFECNIEPSDEFPRDYVLMAVRGTEDWSSNFVCKVYSPAEGIWKEKGLIAVGARNILFDSYVYQKGIFYFLSDWYRYSYLSKESNFYWPYIVVFDPEKGASSFLQIPKSARKNAFLDINLDMGVFKWGKGNRESICLVVLSKGMFTVWALENKETSSWRKILKVRARAMRMEESDPQVVGFTVINGDSLLMATNKRVYRYSLTRHWRWNRAQKVCSHTCGNSVLFYPHSNTLRPCGIGATLIPEEVAPIPEYI